MGDCIYLLVDNATFQPPADFTRIQIAAAGETWEEVERDLGLPEGALVNTIALYNRHAADGSDPLFHKAAKWLKPLDEPQFVTLDYRVDYALFPSVCGQHEWEPSIYGSDTVESWLTK